MERAGDVQLPVPSARSVSFFPVDCLPIEATAAAVFYFSAVSLGRVKNGEKNPPQIDIDKWKKGDKIGKNKTVEAEITLAMLSQRVRDAENRAENKPSNGPLRAQLKAFAEYPAT